MHPLSNEHKLKQIWNFFDKNIICILQFLTKLQLNHFRWSKATIFFGILYVILDVESEFVSKNSYFLGNKGENCCRLISLKDIFKGNYTKLILTWHHWYLLRYDFSKLIGDAKVAKIQTAINRPIMVRLRKNFRFGFSIIKVNFSPKMNQIGDLVV